MLGKDLVSDLHVEENSSRNLSMVLCGNPQPLVKWFLHDKENMTNTGNASTNAEKHEYTYYKYIKCNNNDFRNKEISYNATGATGAYGSVEGTSTIKLSSTNVSKQANNTCLTLKCF